MNADNAWLSNESVPQAHSSQGNGYVDVVNVGRFHWQQQQEDGAIPEPGTGMIAVMSGLILLGLRRRLPSA